MVGEDLVYALIDGKVFGVEIPPETIHLLVVGAAPPDQGQGSLVSWLAGQLAGQLRIPLVIVPGNLNDENGNGLRDEGGLSLDYNGPRLNVRLTLERIDPKGFRITRTVQRTVAVRNTGV